MPFSGWEQGFWFQNKPKTNQKQTKTNKRTKKEGLWPREVALRVTSPDPWTLPKNQKQKQNKNQKQNQ